MLGKLTIDEVCDRASIIALLERYWYGVDIRDEDVAASVFTEDAQYGTATGIEEIKTMVRGSRKFRAMSHLRGNSEINIDGDTAHSDSFVVSFLVEKIDGEEVVTARGLRYVDELVRTPDGWRISSRHGGVQPPHPHEDLWQFTGTSVDTVVKTLVGS